MSVLTYLYRHSWRLLTFATVFSIVSGLCGAGVIALVGKGVAGGIQPWQTGLLFFVLCLLQLTTKSVSEIALIRSTQEAIFSLRVDLSRRVLATPFKRLQELGKPGLLVILTKDVDTFIAAFQTLPAIFGGIVIVAVCLGYMAWLSLPVFAIFIVSLIVCVGSHHVLEQVPMRHLTKLREQMDVLHVNFRGLIEGSKELQLNAKRGKRFIDGVISPAALEFKSVFIRAMSGFVWVVNSGGLLFYLVMGIVLFVVPHWFPQKPGVMTMVTLLLLYMMRPIVEVAGILPGLQQAGISLKKIQQLQTDLVVDTRSGNEGDPFATSAALRVELQGVCHQYPGVAEDRKFVLGPVNLTIQQGECVFIVGGNGSGKTTLAMLLLGLYEPEAGRIVLNGVPVTTDNIDAYRQYFSAVFADFYLFEQLLETDQAAVSERATHYIEKFGMAHKVKVEQGKFSTIDLSTGQRKRLALISSYLEDRAIYLFDEWAADQDPAFKRLFYTELIPELKARGKTVVAITHDDSYFDCADRIIKLEDGSLQRLALALGADAHAA